MATGKSHKSKRFDTLHSVLNKCWMHLFSILTAFIVVLILFEGGCSASREIKYDPPLVTPAPQDDSPTEYLPTTALVAHATAQPDSDQISRHRSSEPSKVDRKTAPAVTARKKVKLLPVRPDPSTGKPPIASIKSTDIMEKMEIRGKWTKIRFAGPNGKPVVGWVKFTFKSEGKKSAPPKVKAVQPQTNKQPTPKNDTLSPM